MFTYFFKIAGERNYHEYRTDEEDKIDAAKEWYRQYIPSLSLHEKTRLMLHCGPLNPGDPLVIRMAQEYKGDAYAISIRYLQGIKL